MSCLLLGINIVMTAIKAQGTKRQRQHGYLFRNICCEKKGYAKYELAYPRDADGLDLCH